MYVKLNTIVRVKYMNVPIYEARLVSSGGSLPRPHVGSVVPPYLSSSCSPLLSMFESPLLSGLSGIDRSDYQVTTV